MKAKSLSRRDFLQAAGIAAGGMILAACAPKATAVAPTQAATKSVKEPVDAPTAEPPAKAVQTIRFYESGGAWQSWVEKLALPQFYDKYPHIKIEYEPIDWDGFPNKTLTQMAAGTAPDVLHGWSQIFQAWQSKKQLLDLTPLVEADFPVADLQDQIPFQWDTLVDPWTNERFAIPGYVDSQIIYYNKDMFDEMGLAYPNKNWSYDDYANASLKLVKKGAKENERWGGWYWYTSWTFNSCHINAFGGKVRDNETWMKSQFHTEETKAAIDWIRKRIWEDKSWINDSQMSGLGISGDSSQLFATGTFGMMEADIEFWPDMAKNVNFKWDIMHLPTGSGGRHALGDNDAWCMYKGTHERGGDEAVSAAWQWMKFMNSEPFQKLIITQSGNVPARKSVNKEWPAMMRKTFPALTDVTLEVIPEAFEMNYLTASEQFRFQADAEPIVTAALEQIWQTGTAGVEILDQVSADIDKSQEAALQKEQG